MKLGQDTELWARIAAIGKLVPGNIETPIAIRTVHEANRVLGSDEIVSKYKKLVYIKLFKWAINRKDFRFIKINQFFMAYHMYVNEMKNNAFSVLMQLLVKNPVLITRSFFYRKIFQITFYRLLQ